MDTTNRVSLVDLTRDELLAKVEQLQGRTTQGGYKVSAKGGLSRYGLGRFPVTLYVSQWNEIIADVQAGVIQHAIESNVDKLTVKPSRD